ncbi:P-loop NTPase [Methanobacterium alcaliphilum]|uniref:nucleotide-binding protein n=1 Tax=Methanobacterium alcaliphilum TaxID=392018 RepID=UPI00200A09C5|nr:P-loop NTPase [Methanobacterium alcaliphilum]MCK9151529.1 P-loop NTPase [Methanobacterium alcaliphilum]
MKIAITGGKGGTGKSTIATSLSIELAKKFKVVLVDVDVECPDDHIILSIKRNKVKDVETLLPLFDLRYCKKCGKCSQLCKENAIFFVKGKYPILISQQCNGCGACLFICPENTIKKDKQIVGSISQGSIEFDADNFFKSDFFNKNSSESFKKELARNIQENFLLISGEVEVGCEATAAVVNATRKYCEQSDQYDFLIIDTPAGTHCNVISGLMGIDMAIAVSEPTPLGAHDLELIIKLLKKINEQECEDLDNCPDGKLISQTKIIINRSDIGNQDLIQKISDNHDIDIIEKIPYDKSFLKKYFAGMPISNQKIMNVANFVRSFNG